MHDPRPEMDFSPPMAPNDYEACMGVKAIIDENLYATTATSRSVLFRDSAIRMTDVRDGTSSTISILECASRPYVYHRREKQYEDDGTPYLTDQGVGWIDSEGGFSLDGASHGKEQGKGPLLTPVVMNATNDNEPYSWHTGGINCLFTDGHVQFIHESIKISTFGR